LTTLPPAARIAELENQGARESRAAVLTSLRNALRERLWLSSWLVPDARPRTTDGKQYL
jgi:hypothetical protein